MAGNARIPGSGWIFMPYMYHFEREGEGDKLAGIVIPIGNEKGYTIGFYNIN